MGEKHLVHPGLEIVAARLDELRQLPAGWLNGIGKPLSPQGLSWLMNALEQHAHDLAASPY